MTPNRRLDQVEPLVADVLQKVDRLIEEQGKILELAVNTKAELDDFATNTKVELNEIRSTIDTTARAVADLTVSTQKQFDSLKAGQEVILQILREKLS